MEKIPITDSNFRIVYPNGSTVDMARDLSVLVRSFVVSAPSPSIYYEKIEGTDGSIRTGKDFGIRSIKAECRMFAEDTDDFFLLRNKVVAALYKQSQYYVICESEPYKRWKVEVSSSFDPDRVGTIGDFTLQFDCADVFAESLGTTLDPFTFDADKWLLGEGFTDTIPAYTHTTTSFSIYNAGHIPIDPIEMPLIITYKGGSSNLTITNETTGDSWKYTGSTASGDTIALNRVVATKNNTSIFGNTNRKIITLAPGWNRFKLSGTSGSFEITFNFRFYYLS
ncbi:phage tail family protein [Bacillus sp. HSf4]|uniref:phage tail family protein n=1 Tax=Bacillus sp. HSf4 TaxID=3035514 RepID=UPI00240A0B4C|nr:phage tail family protein [Bacillus sp. HSf4]WFA04406.1 phage tail family protein [Bacillus sp. HSf4]